MPKYDFDLIVIGGGPAGLAAAKKACTLGKSVAIVEKEKLGGECLWTGCIPGKTLIHLAALVHRAHQTRSLGTCDFSLKWSKIVERIQATINLVYRSTIQDCIDNTDIKVFQGHALFLDNHHLKVGHETLRFEHAIIATGSSPFIPDIPGLAQVAYLTNLNVFNLLNLPKSMIVLGAGPVGVELACAFNRLGVKITLIAQSSVMPNEDNELSHMLTASMINEGIIIYNNTHVLNVAQDAHEITLSAQDSEQNDVIIKAEKILIATGRVANVYELGLENAGIHFDAHGLKIDATLATSQKNIYACGDVVGPFRLSHISAYQAEIAVNNACNNSHDQIDNAQALWVTFSSPEYAAFGLTEEKARSMQIDCAVYRATYHEIDRAYTDDAMEGMLKVICDENNLIIGAHILGAHAGEIIHELHLAYLNKITLSQLSTVVRAYPTYSQLISIVAHKARTRSKCKALK